MKGKICLDEKTLEENGSGEAEVQYSNPPAAGRYDLSLVNDNGFAFRNHLGYGRVAPNIRIYSGASPGAATQVNPGAGTYETYQTRLKAATKTLYNPIFESNDETLDLLYFKIKLTLGTGFSMSAGSFYFYFGYDASVPTPLDTEPTPFNGVYAVARFRDNSANAVRIGTLRQNTGQRLAWYNNTVVTTTNLWTWAVNDTIEVAGYAIPHAWDDNQDNT